METDGMAALLPNAPPRMRIECAYDGLSRRIAKVVKRWQSGSEQWVTIASWKYLYEGWNVLAELDDLRAGALERAYVWGLDLSGSMQGAGGVGGLLGVHDGRSGKVNNVMTEVNGNVMGLVDAVSGEWAARFDYDAFGNRITAAGRQAGLCPFGFSTKYTDAETGLAYYGYRFYDAVRGRWLNRDPIEEEGGMNLYGTLDNDLINKTDFLGQVEVRLDYVDPASVPNEYRVLPRSETKGKVAGGKAETGVSVSCFCKGSCISCVVRVRSRVYINSQLVKWGTMDYTGTLNHEFRHVMSDTYLVKVKLVGGLVKELSNTSGSIDDCTDRTRELREKYQRIADRMNFGEHRPPLNGTSDFTKYSPGSGILWMRPLDESAWKEDLEKGSSSKSANSITFQPCCTK
jgi:RHS repeat-associated protein